MTTLVVDSILDKNLYYNFRSLCYSGGKTHIKLFLLKNNSSFENLEFASI